MCCCCEVTTRLRLRNMNKRMGIEEEDKNRRNREISHREKMQTLLFGQISHGILYKSYIYKYRTFPRKYSPRTFNIFDIGRIIIKLYSS